MKSAKVNFLLEHPLSGNRHCRDEVNRPQHLPLECEVSAQLDDPLARVRIQVGTVGSLVVDDGESESEQA